MSADANVTRKAFHLAKELGDGGAFLRSGQSHACVNDASARLGRRHILDGLPNFGGSGTGSDLHQDLLGDGQHVVEDLLILADPW